MTFDLTHLHGRFLRDLCG